MKIKIYGSGFDRLLQFGGDYIEEYQCTAYNQGVVIFSDGTIIIINPEDITWDIDVLYGNATCIDTEGEYSDIIEYNGDPDWMMLAIDGKIHFELFNKETLANNASILMESVLKGHSLNNDWRDE